MGIEHVFVLMLENRSFDHMLGFGSITGTDAETGGATEVDGLNGNESNLYNGAEYKVTAGADWVISTDPGHEFPNVLEQLCGPGAVYAKGGTYPAINNSGFVASYATERGADPREIMKCYAPGQLPVLNALAREFVVCDNWHAPMPGPTWPNRMFVHGASSGGLDHSPSTLEIAGWESIRGFPMPNGTIFDRLNAAGIPRRLYAGDDFPMVSALRGIHLDDIRHYDLFAGDVAQASYPDRYIFIEPSYDVLNDYRNGNSQHPLGDVTKGEALIKATYEALRKSPIWTSSLLIVTWGEHGGFYDHAAPPRAVAPGDTAPGNHLNANGFTFEQYGPRVPAVVISPLIPKNLVDHRVYDHTSILATVESLFGLAPLTQRDAKANRLNELATLATARDDAPERLPAPAVSGATPAAASEEGATVSRPAATVNQGNLPALLHAAMQQDLKASGERAREAIVKTVASIETRAQACAYLQEVRKKVRVLKAGASGR